MKTDPSKNIPQVNSPSESWIQWHKDLKSYFGDKVASSLFIKAWVIRGNAKANTSELRSYLEPEGIKISKDSWDSIVDAGSGVLSFGGDILKMGKYGAIAVGVILIGGIGLVIFNIAKNPAQAIGTTIKYAK